MIEIPTQKRDKCPACQFGFDHFVPYGDEAIQKAREYSSYQIMRSKFWGYMHPRSVKQLNTYWKGCTIVAENLEDKSKEDIDFDVKLTLKHIKGFRVSKGVTYVEVDSISFENLPHLRACNFFDRAFPVQAKMIKVSVNELMEMIGVESAQG